MILETTMQFCSVSLIVLPKQPPAPTKKCKWGVVQETLSLYDIQMLCHHLSRCSERLTAPTASVHYSSCLLSVSFSLSLIAKTIQTAAPAPCTFISTSRHLKSRWKMSELMRINGVGENTTVAPGDPIYKLFVVVSLFSHST